ncbi:MAG: hypothetical protein FE834_02645 [Gammaproteobacteria bacterium]|uniref:Uncharacterized protein n=1 Tax=hydrothermal vent metagenome TaxID=652676 RepID=A0A1W1E6J4_9ZZZZ|nr:hypothetical protein [Gammaproteobacteria bacterium]
MIIAHNKEYETFVRLLDKSVLQLQRDAKKRPEYYLKRGGVNLEKDVYKFIKANAQNTSFKGKVELISGQRFPDIVAYINENKAYGLEVKTTKSNSWKSTGSSIFEGTRVENVQNIHLLFGKLSDPIEFKCRKYEACLYNVAITHSPRYLIDMNTKEHESIFSKIGIKYNKLRQLDNPFKPIKAFLRKDLKDGEDLWWVDSNENENIVELDIKLWRNLTPERQDELRILALSYFPILFSNNSKKYGQLATWLVSRFGIVNHALRDVFTAGGTITIKEIEFPRVFKHIDNNLDDIISNINKIQEDDIGYYWELDTPVNNKVEEWKKQCLKYCQHLEKDQFNIIKNLLK